MTSDPALPAPEPILAPDERNRARSTVAAGRGYPLTKMVMFGGDTPAEGVRAIAAYVTSQLNAEAEAIGGVCTALEVASVEMVRDCPGCPLRPAYAGERPTIVQVTARALVTPRRDGAPEVTA